MPSKINFIRKYFSVIKCLNILPVLNLLHRNLTMKSGKLSELCERNTHTMQFLTVMAQLKKTNLDVANKDKNENLGDTTDQEEEDMDLMDTSAMEGLKSVWTDEEEED